MTQQLREQANLALDLTQSRYNLGLSSIVEFSRAELQKTEADISDTDADTNANRPGLYVAAPR